MTAAADLTKDGDCSHETETVNAYGLVTCADCGATRLCLCLTADEVCG